MRLCIALFLIVLSTVTSTAVAAPGTTVQASTTVAPPASPLIKDMRGDTSYEMMPVLGKDDLTIMARRYTDGKSVRIVVSFVREGRQIRGCHGVASRQGRDHVFTCMTPDGKRMTYKRYARAMTISGMTFQVGARSRLKVQPAARRNPLAAVVVTAGGNSHV